MDPTLLNYFSFLAICMQLFSCKEGFREAESGVLYKEVSKSSVELKPQDDEYLLLDILLKTSSDSVIYSTRQTGSLFSVKYDTYAQKIMKRNLLQEMFFDMDKGDSTIFKIKAPDLTFISPEATYSTDEFIYCHTKLVDILGYEAYNQWRNSQLKRKQEGYALRLEAKKAREVLVIDSLLNAQEEQYQISPYGIRYIIGKQGIGPYPEDGDILSYTFKVTYLSGEVLPGILGESGSEPQSLELGATGTMESWQESLRLLKKGGTGIFYIPSALAFGEKESYGIKPNATLIANITLIDIKKIN